MTSRLYAHRPSKSRPKGLPDRFDLYEACAQDPARDVRLLRAIHGRDPRDLGEDFSGAGAIAREWAAIVPGGRALAVDADPEPLQRLRGRPGVSVMQRDVRRATGCADVIAALNFAVCELHRRAHLVEYLRRVRARLRAHGIFACDIYGGVDAFETGTIVERRRLRGGARVTYTWEQRAADPFTGMVVNAMHFRVTRAGRKPVTLRDAFVYRWRLWSVPELREAMSEAGFAATEVYHRTEHAVDEAGRAWLSPIDDPAGADPAFIVLVVGRR